MDGVYNFMGKPYFKMDDDLGVPIIFGNTHMDVGVDVGVAPMVR